MIITICGSLTHFKEMKLAKEALETSGHTVLVPDTAVSLLNGEKTLEQVNKRKKLTSEEAAEVKNKFINSHRLKIEKSDAILVVNCSKNDIENYIGGNTLMEMAFALAYNKKIYLLNPIPEVSYRDEVMGCLPIILNGDIPSIGES